MSQNFCAKCGQGHEDEARYCKACGSPLRQVLLEPPPLPAPLVPEIAAADSTPIPPKKDFTAMIVLIVVGVLVVIPLLCALLTALVVGAVAFYEKTLEKPSTSELISVFNNWTALCESVIRHSDAECDDFTSIGFTPPGATEPTNESTTQEYRFEAESWGIRATALKGSPACSWEARISWTSDTTYRVEREVTPKACGLLIPGFMDAESQQERP